MGCKLVTSFPGNTLRSPTLPSILANIMLMNAETGQLEVIVEATTITNWRTAAASLVATKHLYFNRPEMIKRDSKELILSIVGCGVQGEIHSIGFASQFSQIKEIRFYNRTTARRDALHMKLEGLRRQFKNPQLILSKTETPAECVTNADLVVIATNSSTPLIEKKFLKNDVHINGKTKKGLNSNKNLPIKRDLSSTAIGAGMNHHSELHPNIYESSQVYTDHWEGAKTELAGIMDKLTGIVGEVILGQKPQPENGITVFQSMGMGVEDIGVAQMIFEKHQQILQQSAP